MDSFETEAWNITAYDRNMVEMHNKDLKTVLTVKFTDNIEEIQQMKGQFDEKKALGN